MLHAEDLHGVVDAALNKPTSKENRQQQQQQQHHHHHHHHWISSSTAAAASAKGGSGEYMLSRLPPLRERTHRTEAACADDSMRISFTSTLRSQLTTRLPTLRCTKTSPAGRPRISLAGTRASAQPMYKYLWGCVGRAKKAVRRQPPRAKARETVGGRAGGR
jgi:hypothetical protein